MQISQVERIHRRQRFFAALSVSLPEKAFNRNGHGRNLLTAADRRQVILLRLLDLSAAFNYVELCRPWHSTAATSDWCWHVGRCAWVDSVILDQQDARSLVQRSAIQAVASVRCFARFRTGAAAVPSAYCWAWTVDLASWFARPPVWRRQSSVHQRCSQRCTGSCSQGSCSQLRCLRPWRQWVNESQQTAAEPNQDAGHVAPASSWSTLTSTTSWCCRPPSRSSRAHDVTSEFSSTADDDDGSCKNRSCGVCILSVGLL